MYFLWVRKKADDKYRFRYNISFFIDSVVVSVLARYAGDHGSIHGQVAFLFTKKIDVKYNFCYIDEFARWHSGTCSRPLRERPRFNSQSRRIFS